MHFHRQKDAYTHVSAHTNTHNRKSVNEWEGAGRLAGAVLVEDIASVHLSISKHSQLSFLSTGGGHFFALFSCASSSSPEFCFLLLAPAAFYRLIYLLPTNPFISFLLLHFFHCVLLLFLFHSTLLPSIPSFLAVSCALSGTVHSATKQSCLQHHTLANQARPECSSP